MATTINTNGILTDYPTPGKNNSSEGLRTNFTIIKTNLDNAGNALTDLQNKALLKSGLDGTTLNNDMANASISNAAITGFRKPVKNIGIGLNNQTFLVKVNQGDVQTVGISGNVVLQFGEWSPDQTYSEVLLRISGTGNIQIPSNCDASLLENYQVVNGNTFITIPANTSYIELIFSSIDCGKTISVKPNSRGFKTTQIISYNPSPVGKQGDVAGTVAIAPIPASATVTATVSNVASITGDIASNTNILTSNANIAIGTQISQGTNIATGTAVIAAGNVANTYLLNYSQANTITGSINGNLQYFMANNNLTTDTAVKFNGNVFGNVSLGNVYYVATATANGFSISATPGGNQIATQSVANVSMTVDPQEYLYVCGDSFNATSVAKTITTISNNVITISDNSGLSVNQPVQFTGTLFGGVSLNTVYYIKSLTGTSLTISASRFNGIAGSIVALTNGTGSMTMNAYSGKNIWKRTMLEAF